MTVYHFYLRCSVVSHSRGVGAEGLSIFKAVINLNSLNDLFKY